MRPLSWPPRLWKRNQRRGFFTLLDADWSGGNFLISNLPRGRNIALLQYNLVSPAIKPSRSVAKHPLSLRTGVKSPKAPMRGRVAGEIWRMAGAAQSRQVRNSEQMFHRLVLTIDRAAPGETPSLSGDDTDSEPFDNHVSGFWPGTGSSIRSRRWRPGKQW